MDELLRAKKLEVAQYYITGLTYKEIQEKTGVSHGSIANIVKELETGELTIPGTSSDQIDDLHRLSLDLKKKNLSASQALLGLQYYQKSQALGILPEQFDRWAQLISTLTKGNFPASDFLRAAIRLHQLEMSEGKPFELLTEEYQNIKEASSQLKAENNTLETKKKELSRGLASVSARLETINKTKGKLEASIDKFITREKELKPRVERRQADDSRLTGEVRELEQRKRKLSAEIDGKEASLVRLNDIGFQDEDLLRLRTILERIGHCSGISQDKLKEKFFAALGIFKDITELQSSRAEEAAIVNKLTEKKALLTGEVTALEEKSNLLNGEIKEKVSNVTNQIVDTGEKAVLQLQQQTDCIKQQLDNVAVEALSVAAKVTEMKVAVKQGQDSGKILNDFIKEIKSEWVRTNA